MSVNFNFNIYHVFYNFKSRVRLPHAWDSSLDHWGPCKQLFNERSSQWWNLWTEPTLRPILLWKRYSVKLPFSPLTWWLGNFRFGYIILNLWGPWVQNYIWVVVHPPPMKVLLKQKLVGEVLISKLANVHVLCKGPKFFIRLCAKVPLPKMCDNKVCSNSWFQGKPAFNKRWWIIFGKNQLLRKKCFEGWGRNVFWGKKMFQRKKNCATLSDLVHLATMAGPGA